MLAKPSKLELEVAKSLGDEWKYVGDGKVSIGGLVPDFNNRTRKEILEVLGCYYIPTQFIIQSSDEIKGIAILQGIRYRANGHDVEFLWEHDVKERRKLAFVESGVKDPSIYAKAWRSAPFWFRGAPL
jgi:hypothetical protein